MATYSIQCSKVGAFNYATNFTLYVILDEININIENNSSQVNYNVYCQSNGSGSINSRHLKYFSINGQEIVNSTSTINASSPNAYIPIASGTIGPIMHNADGTKAVSFEAKIQASSYGIAASINNSFTLQTIPRASSISCTTANITEPAIISINSASSNFWHRIWANFGNLENIIISENQAGGTLSWTIPETFYSQIPNSKSGVGTIYCATYSGQTQIGLKSTLFTVTTNEEKCRPIVSAELKDINEDTIALTGDNSKLIKYKSNVQISLSIEAKNSATISNKKINETILEEDIIIINNIETNTFDIIVTDSRGYSNIALRLETEMIDYIPITIKPSIKRIQPTTGEVEITYTGNYYNGSFGTTNNNIDIKWFYKIESENEWTLGGTLTPTIEENTYSNGNNPILLGNTFDYQKSYDFYLQVTDKLSEVISIMNITQGIPIFNWGKDFVNINANLKIFEKPLLELIFPIGSTYITQEDVNPSTILNFGTWERLKGKVCLGLDENDEQFNQIGKTGGEKEHILTISEIPSHNHIIENPFYSFLENAYGLNGQVYKGEKKEESQTITSNVGGGQAHNNLQPFEIVGYMWIRKS